MNDFEIRYNAVEQANLIMISKLVLEVARDKGADGIDWIDRFRNACVTEISDTQNRDGAPRNPNVVEMSKSVVVNVALMAKDRFSQLKTEGSL